MSSASTNTENTTGEYRRLSLWAPGALLLGFAAALALLSPVFWFVAGIALAVSAIALRKIHRADPPVAGRTLALVSLALTLLFAAAAPTRYFFRRHQIVSQASAVGQQWLDLLRTGEAYVAIEARRPAARRRPLDDNLLAHYLKDPDRRKRYEKFLNEPLVRTMRALPNNAEVRFYQTERVECLGDRDQVSNAYAVTYFQDRRRRSFFVLVVLERRDNPVSVDGHWRVLRYEGGYRPLASPR